MWSFFICIKIILYRRQIICSLKNSKKNKKERVTMQNEKGIFLNSRVKLVKTNCSNALPNGIHGTVKNKDNKGTHFVIWDNDLCTWQNNNEIVPLNDFEKSIDGIFHEMLETQKMLNAIFNAKDFWEEAHTKHYNDINSRRMIEILNNLKQAEFFFAEKS